MKLSSKQQAVLIAYLHGVVVAAIPLIMIGEHDWRKYGYAVMGGVIVPALRALNKKDTAFGLIADVVQAKLPTDKVASADITK